MVTQGGKDDQLLLHLLAITSSIMKQEEFRKTIRKRGYRVTPQRELILDAVRVAKGHSTAEQVYARVVKRAPSLNRATVYRTLEFLTQQHMITSTDLGTGGKVFEIAAPEPHHHLVCNVCGEVTQIGHERLSQIFMAIEREHGFKITTDHLALFGLCEHCRTKE
jgi:Fur family transcriptional regulator, ferric uptake regulator